MAYEIKYKDVDKNTFEQLDWYKDDLNEDLKDVVIINVETKKDFIRFWYKQEN